MYILLLTVGQLDMYIYGLDYKLDDMDLYMYSYVYHEMVDGCCNLFYVMV